MKPFQLLVATGLAAVLLVPHWAMAGEGHDHGEAAPAATGTALPRFAAVSKIFELVGVLNGKQITLYLDHAADNSPVTEAQIEFEIDGKKYLAAKQGNDEFEVVLPEAPKSGVLPITATVTAKASAGTDTDRLVGELDIQEAVHADEAGHVHSWKDYAGWAAGGLAVIAALGMLLAIGRRVSSSRKARVGGVG